MMAVLHNVVDNVTKPSGYVVPVKGFSFATANLFTYNSWICAVISCSINSSLDQRKSSSRKGEITCHKKANPPNSKSSTCKLPTLYYG
jgi:hypothetical protein